MTNVYLEPHEREEDKTKSRKQCQLLIARQAAIGAGYTWQVHPNPPQQKVQDRYLALAGSILATVERAAMVKWSDT